jgi:acyl carrier protein
MSTREEIRSVIVGKLGLSDGAVKDEMTLEELGLDSLLAAEILIAIEQRLGSAVDASAISGMVGRDTPLGELIDLVITSLGASSKAGAA